MASYDSVLPAAPGGSPEASPTRDVPQQAVLPGPAEAAVPAAAAPARRPSRRVLTALALVAATAVAGGAVLLVGGGSDGPPTQTGPDLPPGPAVLAPEDAPGAARLPGGTEPYTGVDPLTGDSFEIRLPPGLRSPAASRPKDVLFSTSIKGYGFLGLARVDRVPSARALVDSGDPEITAESVIRPSAVRDLPAWSREMPLRSGPARAFVFEHEGHVYQLDMVPGPAVTEAGTDSALAAVQTFRWTS